MDTFLSRNPEHIVSEVPGYAKNTITNKGKRLNSLQKKKLEHTGKVDGAAKELHKTSKTKCQKRIKRKTPMATIEAIFANIKNKGAADHEDSARAK